MSYFGTRWLLVGLYCWGACATWSHAQQAAATQAPRAAQDSPTAGGDDVPTVRLRITPRAESVPALAVRLLPAYEHLKPGNGVPFYYRAMLTMQTRPSDVQKQYVQQYETWLAWPLDPAHKPAMVDWVNAHQPVLDELRTAAHREDCDWEYQLRELRGIGVLSFNLEDAQQARALARLLQVKIRIELSEGRVEDALESIRIGNRLASDVARPRLLISSLVGVAIASMMNEEVERLMCEPQAPNLYWALAALPDPLISLRPALEHERLMAEQMFPALQDPEGVTRSAEEWQRLLTEMMQGLQQVGAGAGEGGLGQQFAMTAWLLMRYPSAKQALLDAGESAEKVDKMSAAQVVVTQTARSHRRFRDELFKWTYLPYDQALRGLLRAEEKIERSKHEEPIPISALLLPAVRAALLAELRLERRTALLQTVEAIRMHAAAAEGKLPESLDAITVVPVPRDPLNQQPFSYRLDGTTAVLEIPAAPRMPVSEARRYVIELRE